jgi:competence protein ComEC
MFFKKKKESFLLKITSIFLLIAIFSVTIGCSSLIDTEINSQIRNTEKPSFSTAPEDKNDTIIPEETERPKETPSQPDIKETLEVHFLDVGQGDSAFIKVGENAMLIDAGDRGYGQGIVNYLKAQGVQKLNYLILTHPHADHIGGAAEVIKSIEVERIVMPKATHTSKIFENLLLAIQNKGLKITPPSPGSEYKLGEASFVILAPNSLSYKSINNHSVVTKIVFGNTSFLFTGDAESVSENEMLNKGFNLESNVLKVGHHGSNTSTSEKFLKAVNPEYAVISVGEGNSYGHPTQTILGRLNSYGVKVYRTDKTGTIIAISDGVNINFYKRS